MGAILLTMVLSVLVFFALCFWIMNLGEWIADWFLDSFLPALISVSAVMIARAIAMP